MINANSITEYKEKPKKIQPKDTEKKSENESLKKTLSQQQQAIIDNKYTIDRSRLGGELYTPKGEKKPAFRDAGDTIVVKAKSPRTVAQDVVTLAKGKGWDKIKVTGKKDFKRAVWIDATKRGLTVHGYTPTEQDIRLANDGKKERKSSTKASTSKASEQNEKVVPLKTKARVTASQKTQTQAETVESVAVTKRTPRSAAKAKPMQKIEDIAESYAKLITKNTVSQLEIQAALLRNFEQVKDKYAEKPKQTQRSETSTPKASPSVKAARPAKQSEQSYER